MNVNAKGMQYPDLYITRFFFKEGLHNYAGGNVLELGCGNGNNLSLFYQYGWNVVGIDYSSSELSLANYNFSTVYKSASSYSFHEYDLNHGLLKLDMNYQAVILPNILYYLKRESCISVLKSICEYVDNTFYIFLRMRSINDYRYGKGEKVSENEYILDIHETGEYGCRNVFYEIDQVKDMLKTSMPVEPVDVDNLMVFKSVDENLQNNVVIDNHDYIMWGKVSLNV